MIVGPGLGVGGCSPGVFAGLGCFAKAEAVATCGEPVRSGRTHPTRVVVDGGEPVCFVEFELLGAAKGTDPDDFTGFFINDWRAVWGVLMFLDSLHMREDREQGSRIEEAV
ncbi:hypothetical protein V5R04_07295 [Jonesiaceae bacterium BS-20]|uniref:Uncharacterized protein n=1 Tax=Jonesiaceae bacterium BS-20 TaxID=3120821 RepID=A0AAU7E101_9MICO